MLKRIMMTLATAAVAFITMAPATAHASDWWIEYSNKASHNCIDVKNSSSSNGAIVQEYPCKNPGTSGAANQQWQFQGHQFVVLHSGKCLDLAGWSTADGGTVQQWSCTGALNQSWTSVYVSTNPRGSENWLIKSDLSGKCLNRANVGNALYQTACDSSNLNQVWTSLLIDSGCTTCIAPARRD
ncbi:hypothetical protein Lfu02_31670 [Longispora fulva]|uniref:Ricin B lectin domain-containing protein n=1 Tax=Longispora fulva TaxID=619741 RepID=A0A8J7GKG2_9ACTN|nr:RICIN domain-containing protein [Longispora fulva]MBG6139300.1 hypothetical protein [Longispora fulva]GIG58795.1 hypothetical protein Lfu02_31670 [Longispora fulva]